MESKMKSIVIYSRKSKRCQKVAMAAANQCNLPMASVEDRPDIDEYDMLIVVGVGKYSGEKNNEVEVFLKQLKENLNKNAVLITLDSMWFNASIAPISNVKGNQLIAKNILEQKGIHILGEHMCETQYLFNCIGHPNNRDIIKTVDWLTKIV